MLVFNGFCDPLQEIICFENLINRGTSSARELEFLLQVKEFQKKIACRAF